MASALCHGIEWPKYHSSSKLWQHWPLRSRRHRQTTLNGVSGNNWLPSIPTSWAVARRRLPKSADRCGKPSTSTPICWRHPDRHRPKETGVVQPPPSLFTKLFQEEKKTKPFHHRCVTTSESEQWPSRFPKREHFVWDVRVSVIRDILGSPTAFTNSGYGFCVICFAVNVKGDWITGSFVFFFFTWPYCRKVQAFPVFPKILVTVLRTSVTVTEVVSAIAQFCLSCQWHKVVLLERWQLTPLWVMPESCCFSCTCGTKKITKRGSTALKLI